MTVEKRFNGNIKKSEIGENGKYVYEVSYRSPLTMELLQYETKTMKLTGVVEDGTYKISNIEF